MIRLLTLTFMLCAMAFMCVLPVTTNAAATTHVYGKRPTFDWKKLLGIGIEIRFGQSIPGCACCYGGLCEIKLGSAMIVNGPLDDARVAGYADGLLANDQVIIGQTTEGSAYLIFNRNCSRPELQGSSITLKTAPKMDPDLQVLYGIAPMKAGTYPIIDNGAFKMIKLN